jgi:DNA-binding NtrC family response regulator
LLRVLQEGEIKRVGADETRTVDVRVLAATNVDLMNRIHGGLFRRDLYYRLHVIALELPALRDRGDDVLLLANHYLQKFARSMGREPKRLGVDAIRAVREYDWPGNVRELEHAIEHAMVLAQREIITASDLPFVRQTPAFRDPPTAPALVVPSAPRRLDAELPPAPTSAMGFADGPNGLLGELAGLPYAEAKRRLVSMFDDTYTRELLKRASGNMSEAARRAGLDRSNFRRLLKRHKGDP